MDQDNGEDAGSKAYEEEFREAKEEQAEMIEQYKGSR